MDFKLFFLIVGKTKRIIVHILAQYNNLKKGNFESIHEFSSRFMRVYNSIPADIKPLVGVAKLHYVDSFESDFALLLRERKLATLPTMFKDAFQVEANLMVFGKIKQKVEENRRNIRE